MRTRITQALLLLTLPSALAGCGGDPTAVKTPADPRIAEGTTILQTPDYEANPAVSPDGAWLLYESDLDGDMEIFLLPVQGGQTQRLTDNDAFDSAPQWSPDGTKVVFESDRTGTKRIHVLDRTAPDFPVLVLTSGSGEDGSPDWSPLGLWIAFESSRDKDLGSDIYLVSADGSQVRRLTDSPGGVYCRSADWSPDGTTIVYESNATGSSALFTIPASGGKGTQITPDQGYEGHPAWSPRGDCIAFEGTLTGPSQIYLVELAEGRLTQLTFQGGHWPCWTPAADAVTYCAAAGSEFDIMIVGVD